MTFLSRTVKSPLSVSLRLASAIGVALLLMLGASIGTTPAAAQTACMSRADVLEQLSSKYAETPISLGLEKSGDVVEIFSSGDGDTWTMVRTRPDGETCMIASGEAWQSIPAPERVKGFGA